ncbi:MAG: molybdotransferase-like divisome protein Glp [Streptomycetales bacterium]
MKSVDKHLSAILDAVQPLAPIGLQLLDAHGCLLDEDVVAVGDLPAFDNSSMDGYAVCMADVRDASEETPGVLPVVGDVAAGDTDPQRIVPGMAFRVMTGAPVPAGTQAVVPLEWTDQGLATVHVMRAPEEGSYLRLRGDDVTAGETVLRAGTLLGAPQIGLLAAIGRDVVRARPRPRVVVLSTGSELVEPGATTPLPGQIPDANSFMLTAAAREAGAIAYRVGIVPDDGAVVLDTLEDQLIRADAVVTSGGVSVGAYDVVKEVLSRLGTVTFGEVAMQPGKPQGFGAIGADATPIFTLPGNPVSAYVSFEIFVRPAIRRMLGLASLHRPTLRARCLERMASPKGKRQYARGWYESADDDPTVRPVGGAGSHLIGDLAQANCFIVVPEDTVEVTPGQTVDAVLLDRPMP